jgi:hypothetical protein
MLNVDEATLNAKADAIKLEDYNKASDKEDAEKGLSVADVIAEDSIVIVTSTCDDKDKEIFRSKFKLNEAGVPDLQANLLGKKVGDKVEVALNGITHNLEVLGIRTAPPVVTETTDEEQAVQH